MPGDWADAFSRGFNDTMARRRQSRMDLLAEELSRGKLALQQAAARRMDAVTEDRLATGSTLRDRLGYTDRYRALNPDVAPFPKLLGQFPEAGASPYTTRATGLTEQLARHPELTDQRTPLVEGDQISGPWEPGQQPTYGEERGRNIDAAYDKFGEAMKARLEAQAKLKRDLMKPGSPYMKDLEEQRRSISARRKQAQALISGSRLNPNTGVMEILRPEELKAAKEQGEQMLAQLQAEEAAVNAAVSQRVGSRGAAPRLGPGSMVEQLHSQGMTPQQIVAQLRAHYSAPEVDYWLQSGGLDDLEP